MCDMFGGPSQAETGTLSQTQGLSTALMSAFNQQYAQQQGVLKQLGSQIFRIQSGQTGTGFSGGENAALISQIQNQGAAQARNAIQQQRQLGAGTMPGSGLSRQSGINAQVAGGISALAGAQTANNLIGETAQNYAQGRANAISAEQGLQSLQDDFSPSTYSNQASSNLVNQFKESDEINQQNIQRSQAIAGLIEKGVMGAATFGLGGVGALGAGEGIGEGASDFLSGGMNALTGSNFGINPPSAGGGGNGGAPSGGGWNGSSS
jgi:hypothetical protein